MIIMYIITMNMDKTDLIIINIKKKIHQQNNNHKRDKICDYYVHHYNEYG